MTRGNRFDASPAGAWIARGRRGAIVGASILQLPGGIESEFKRINADINTFSSELAAEANRHGYTTPPPVRIRSQDEIADHVPESVKDQGVLAISNWVLAQEKLDRANADLQAQIHAAQPIPTAPIARMYASIWLPWLKQWNDFYSDYHEGSWWTNHAPEAEQFHKQLINMRKIAKGLGMKIMSPDPIQFSSSVLDPSEGLLDKLGDVLSQIGTAGKYALYAALGLGGIYAVTQIVREAKK